MQDPKLLKKLKKTADRHKHPLRSPLNLGYAAARTKWPFFKESSMTAESAKNLSRRLEIPLVWDSVGQVRLEAGMLFSSFDAPVRANSRAVWFATFLFFNNSCPRPVNFVRFLLKDFIVAAGTKFQLH